MSEPEASVVPEATPASNDAAKYPVNLPSGLTEQAVKDYAGACNKAHEEWFSGRRSAIKRLHEYFDNAPTVGKSGKSIPYPICYSIVETLNARIYPTLFNRPKYTEMIPKFQTDNTEGCRAVEDFINQQVMWCSRSPERGKATVKGGLVEGVAIVKSLWRGKTEKRIEPQMEGGLYQGDKTVDEDSSGWQFEYKSPLDMAWEPRCWSNINDAAWVRERSYMSLNELLQWEKDGRIQKVDEIAKITPSGAENKDEWGKANAAYVTRGGSHTYGDLREYAIDEWFASMTWKDGEVLQQGEFHFMIVEKQVLVLFEENALIPVRKPYRSVPCILNVRKMYGKAAHEAVMNLAEQINIHAAAQGTLVEQATDSVTYYDQRSGLSGKIAYLKQKGFVPVDDVRGIFRPPADHSSVTVNQNYINYLVNMARESAAATEQAQGTEGADTATEFQGLLAGAMARFSDIIDTWNTNLIAWLCREAFYFNRQFGQPGQMFYREGGLEGKSVEITPEMLAGDYEFVPVNASTVNEKRLAIRQDDELFANIAKAQSSNPMFWGPTGEMFDLKKFFTERNLANREIKNGSTYWTAAPMMPPVGLNGPMAGLPAPIPSPGAGQPMPEGMSDVAG